MEIKYIKNEEINRLRYDNTLKRSFNANVFAYSWYLDLACDEWDLLIEGDYETVCPLPLKKTMGINTVKQPSRIPLLGVFSSKHLPSEKVTSFIKAIPYKHVNLTLNHLNRLQNLRIKGIRKVAVLDLIPPYEKTIAKYSEKAREILPQNDGTFVMRSVRTDEYMFFKRSQKKGSTILNMQLTRIMNYAIRYKSAGIYSVYSPRNELIGAAFLIKSNNRVFLFDCVENPEGHKRHAIFRAINHLIETNSESNLTLELPFECKALEQMINFDHHHCQKYKKGIL
ncbi:hypothetical protein [Marinilabilia rubra]|uniref:BioF2-like acetyltransferase domain-containing protein n=1 Tax=Marinilabilia rubra TaxID=2162893 RepID=A0A2U2BBH3_9BACT|nr:hypothetical protein [Marinilabilia rubra]PWE00409.1 hypothetical protein DDZ16_05605 [Marinilabilia rubra]